MKFLAGSTDFRKGGIRSIVFFITVLQGISSKSSGQTAEKIIAGLVKSGFENTRCTLSGERCYISIENHTWRWDAEAISKAFDIIASELDSSLEINLLITDFMIPRLLIVAGSGDWKDFRSGIIDRQALVERLQVTVYTHSASQALEGLPAGNRSAGKVDLVLYPQFYFENTRIYKFYETQLNIAPAFELQLWKGSRITGQAIIPLHNTMGYEGDRIRPGLLTLAQDFRVTNSLTGSVTAGNFAGGSYGISGSLRYCFLGQRFNLEMNSGLSGSSHIIDNQWIHGSLNRFSGSVSASWFWTKYNLELKGGAARYINEDPGLFASCLRYFNETVVGLYVQTSESSNNGGFFFSVPMCRKQRASRKHFRVSLAPRYEMTYNAGTEYFYGQSLQTDLLPIYKCRFTWPGSLKTMLLNQK